MWERKLKLYREHERTCKEKNVQSASTKLFYAVFKASNIDFILHIKNQCETFRKYNLGKITAENYQNHQKNRVEGRK